VNEHPGPGKFIPLPSAKETSNEQSTHSEPLQEGQLAKTFEKAGTETVTLCVLGKTPGLNQVTVTVDAQIALLLIFTLVCAESVMDIKKNKTKTDASLIKFSVFITIAS